MKDFPLIHMPVIHKRFPPLTTEMWLNCDIWKSEIVYYKWQCIFDEMYYKIRIDGEL